ncbi:MAG: hypothetical protein E7517_04490 [Ruminococcaceae bacterium]|nr:hypothetical protein [Oscillospiraceae bacterium]
MKRTLLKKPQSFIKYALFFFILLLAYSFMIVNRFQFWSIDKHIYTFFLTDYSFGFCTKFLLGATYHLFFKEVIEWQLVLFLSIVLVLFFAFVSLLLAKVLSAQENAEDRNRLLILFFFFLTGPSTFSSLSYQLGIYDTYWFVLALAMVVFVSNKYLKFLIPALCVLCILVHFTSVISFIVFFCLLMWYEAVRREGKHRAVMVALLIFCALLSLGLTLYFIRFESDNLKYTMEEFDKELLARNRFTKGGGNIDIDYYNSVFYHQMLGGDYHDMLARYYENLWIDPSASSLPAPLVSFINIVGGYVHYIKYNFSNDTVHILSTAAVTILIDLPLLVVFYGYWRKKRKEQKGFFAKLLYVLIMLQYPVALCGCLLSVDVVRWMMHGFVLQFVLFLYILIKEKDWEYLKECLLFRADYRYSLCYLLCYALTVFDPLT